MWCIECMTAIPSACTHPPIAESTTSAHVDCDCAFACRVPRPRSTSAIFPCVILAGSFFPRTNLCTLLSLHSVLGPLSCLPDVSCEYCDVWLVCVAFTGIIESWCLQHFGFGRIAQNFLLRAALRAGHGQGGDYRSNLCREKNST